MEQEIPVLGDFDTEDVRLLPNAINDGLTVRPKCLDQYSTGNSEILVEGV